MAVAVQLVAVAVDAVQPLTLAVADVDQPLALVVAAKPNLSKL